MVILARFDALTQSPVAVAMGSVAQFRVMGGCIALAIVTATSNTLKELPPTTQSLIRHVFSASYNLQMKVLAGFAGGQIIASLLNWQKNPLVVWLELVLGHRGG
ncbi:hypothetical protein BO70DRAFT_428848 [Aspergillus heteromorphus CBS 117.55]|uniref:Major facilitator superfamily (MFS) profile domain-containing protein n=1 Tax=Aspergillus heteromorphus CBS 117.55 TaxID=1448321 RepID=A0A317WCU1_9EURO|nr:uncharacterized protein BO70DRAFT_428848 [Aspergillus heteromorphus CBS 117.55]PWY83581.1 hypothetical protein BO70DRAFT_428848 [Aspergillus heteromorphus CBS 117.55]